MKRLTLIVCAMLMIQFKASAQTIPTYLDTTQLIAWYPFNGDADDESGNNLDGVTNGAVLTTDRNGNSNSAYYFDGINDFIELPSSLELDNLNGGFTISLWYYLDTTSNFTGGLIELQDGVKSLSNYSLDEVSVKASYGQLTSRLNRSYRSGNSSGGSSGGYNQSQTVSNQWVNIVSVFHTDNKNVTLYVNGYRLSPNSSGSYSFTSLTGGGTGTRKIGSTVENLYSPQYWKGKVDDISIWNRALDCNEVSGMYAQAAGVNSNDICFASIDSTGVSCTNDYELSINSAINLTNSKSIKVLNGYACSFSDYDIWSGSDDYAVGFWFNSLNTDSVDILSNNMGSSMGSSSNKLIFKNNQLRVESGNQQSNWNNIDTSWNHVALHIKKTSSVSRSILYINGVAIDSVNSSNRFEEFSFGDVLLKQVQPYEFLVDNVTLLSGDSIRELINDINSDCAWNPSSPQVKRFYTFENASANTSSFVDQLSLSYSKKISGNNYSGKIIISDNVPSCSANYDILWSDGNNKWSRIVSGGSSYSAMIFNSLDTNYVSISLPQKSNSNSGYIDLFPDTIISYGNTVDTVIDWLNWPPDTSIVYGAEYEYVLPQNSYSFISPTVSQNATVNNSTVRFKTSGTHKFYLSDWGLGNNSCSKEESVFVEILDSINLVNRNDICDTVSELYPVKEVTQGYLRLKGQSLKCTDISPFQDLNEFSVSFHLYWKGGASQTLFRAPGLLDIYSISNDSLIVTDFIDTIAFQFPLLEWEFLTVTSDLNELNAWIGDSLAISLNSSRTRPLNIKTGYSVGRDIIYHPLSNTYGSSGVNYSFEFEGGLTELSYWSSSLDSVSVSNHVFFLNLKDGNLIASYDFDTYGINPEDLSFKQKELSIFNYGLSGGYIYDFPDDRYILQTGTFYEGNSQLMPALNLSMQKGYQLTRTLGQDTIELFHSITDSIILNEPFINYGITEFACSLDTISISLSGAFDSILVDQVFFSLKDTVLKALPSSQDQYFEITGFKDSSFCSYEIEIERHEPIRNTSIWNDTVLCATDQINFTITGYESIWMNSILTDSIVIVSDTTIYSEVMDTTGCIRRDTILFNLDNYNPLPASLSICESDSIFLGSQILEPYDSIGWYKDLTPISDASYLYISDTATYSLHLVRNNGCEYRDSSFLNFYQNPSWTLSVDSISCYGTTTGEIEILTLDSVWWPNYNLGSNFLDSLGDGNYVFEATTTNGCKTLDSVTLANPDTLIFSTTTNNISCYAQNDGSIEINHISGIPDFYTFWPDINDTIDLRSGLSPGVYQAIIGDGSTCPSDSIQINIIEPDSLYLTLAGKQNVSCYGGQDGFIWFKYSGGQSTATYQLLDSLNQTISTGSLIRDSIYFLSALSSNTYTLNLTDSGGCVDSIQLNISEPIAPLSIITTINPSVCPGDSSGYILSSVSGGTIPYEFIWSSGDTTKDIFNLADGLYTLTITDSLNCLLNHSETIFTAPYIPVDTMPSICIVTITDSLKSKVIWEKPSVLSGISAYQISRLGVTNWVTVGTVSATDSSYFIDNSSTPTTKAHTYGIQIIDSCSNWWGDISNGLHTTSLLQSSVGTSGQVNLAWTQYQGVNTSYFRILRKVGNSGFIIIDSVNNQTFNYVDNNPPTGNTVYAIEGVLTSSCYITAKNGTVGSYRTNYITEQTIGLKENGYSTVLIHPNPAHSSVSLHWPNDFHPSQIRIFNSIGRVIFSSTKVINKISVEGFAAGTYLVEITHEGGLLQEKLVIRH